MLGRMPRFGASDCGLEVWQRRNTDFATESMVTGFREFYLGSSRNSVGELSECFGLGNDLKTFRRIFN